MPLEDHLINTVEDQLDLSATARVALTKKQGVSGQSIAASHNIKIEVFEKDYRCKTMIKEAIMENDFMRNLSPPQVGLSLVSGREGDSEFVMTYSGVRSGAGDAGESGSPGLLRYKRR